MKGKVWEPQTIGFLCDHASGDIIHGGAFFGDFLPALSRCYERVWAFEPNKDSFRCAETTARLNDLVNVTIFYAGAGRESASLDICTESNGNYLGGGSFIVEQPGATPIVAIDQTVPADRPIGAIHLDVEGYEGPALEGAEETIRRWSPLLVLETVPEIVRDLGYREVAAFEHNHVLRHE